MRKFIDCLKVIARKKSIAAIVIIMLSLPTLLVVANDELVSVTSVNSIQKVVKAAVYKRYAVDHFIDIQFHTYAKQPTVVLVNDHETVQVRKYTVSNRSLVPSSGLSCLSGSMGFYVTTVGFVMIDHAEFTNTELYFLWAPGGGTGKQTGWLSVYDAECNELLNVYAEYEHSSQRKMIEFDDDKDNNPRLMKWAYDWLGKEGFYAE
ncbi:MAG: hypothetical protein HRU04_25395 [Oceanospirillaceae bacterium]|nr:hypothetical protein [Oceanospirillaceae bacterium]